MGQDWWPYKAIPFKLLFILLEPTELKVQEALTLRDKNCWLVFHTYVTICYTLPLCASEGFLLDLAGKNQNFSAGGDRYMVVALLKSRANLTIRPTYFHASP
jgi:hypothetical protein